MTTTEHIPAPATQRPFFRGFKRVPARNVSARRATPTNTPQAKGVTLTAPRAKGVTLTQANVNSPTADAMITEAVNLADATGCADANTLALGTLVGTGVPVPMAQQWVDALSNSHHGPVESRDMHRQALAMSLIGWIAAHSVAPDSYVSGNWA